MYRNAGTNPAFAEAVLDRAAHEGLQGALVAILAARQDHGLFCLQKGARQNSEKVVITEECLRRFSTQAVY